MGTFISEVLMLLKLIHTAGYSIVCAV